jgi:hypothetical protein
MKRTIGLLIAGLIVAAAGCKHVYTAGDAGAHYRPISREAPQPGRNAS